MPDPADPFLGAYAAEKALRDMPEPATELPTAAGTKSVVGTARKTFALGDHTHEVRARRKRVVLALAVAPSPYAGKFIASWTFDKPFATKPIIVPSPEDDGGNPVQVQPIAASFTQDGDGLWTGVTVRGWRAQPIPQNLVSMLLGGVFNLFGASAAGVVVGLTAAEETPTA